MRGPRLHTVGRVAAGDLLAGGGYADRSLYFLTEGEPMTNEITYYENSVGNFRLLGFATGVYVCKCFYCGATFAGDKRAISCLACAIKSVEERFSTCRWEYDDDGYYKTSCGEAWCFPEGTPSENKLKFCPICGKKVIIAEEPSCQR